jgi:hypothetical protein
VGLTGSIVGVRPVGERAPSGAPVADPQFFWLWAPINFDDFATHFDVNELTDGTRWHETGLIVPTADDVGLTERTSARRRRCARSTIE